MQCPSEGCPGFDQSPERSQLSDDQRTGTRQRQSRPHEFDRLTAPTIGPTQIDERDAVLSMVDHDAELSHQPELLDRIEIAEVDRILQTVTVPPNDIMDTAKSFWFTDVIGHQPPSPIRHLVTTGTYSGTSPMRCAARRRACTSNTRR